MSVPSWMILNLYTAFLLILIYIPVRNRAGRERELNRIFNAMLWTTVVLLLTDSLSHLNELASSLLLLSDIFLFLSFLGEILLPLLWFFYVRSYIHSEPETSVKQTLLICFPLILDILLLFLSLFNGWILSFSPDGIYSRGPFFAVHSALMCTTVFLSELLIIRNRNKVEKEVLGTLLFFPLPPLIGIALQLVFQDLAFGLPGIAVSVILIFINIQIRISDIDYLTGAYTRSRLDNAIDRHIRENEGRKRFAAIMIDVDNFKSINDRFGHNAGDLALKESVAVIRQCLRMDDLLARYGGDEFCIILDNASEEDLKRIISRIRENLSRLNSAGTHPYQLSFSMGYSIYGPDSGLNREQFQKLIDQKMYENKKGGRR